MTESTSTCWTLIRGAAGGDRADRDLFARQYEPVIRAYLGARWRDDARRREVDDAVQDVFLDCFRADGPLARVDPDRPGGFRGYLYGVVRHVAQRHERARAKRGVQPDSRFDLNDVAGDDESLAVVFDRAWAHALMRHAADLMAERAQELDDERAPRRVELLRLRFREDRPIREIAAEWDVEPEHLHREYARARREFQAALVDVVKSHQPDRPAEAAKECARLIRLLG